VAQFKTYWSIIIAHLATVGADIWMPVLKNVVAFIHTMMKIISVSVTERVCIYVSQNSSITMYVCVFIITTELLCGKCRHGKGVSVLLNNCKSCEAANLLLILALGTYI